MTPYHKQAFINAPVPDKLKVKTAKYEVSIVYKGQSTYIVEAESEDEAFEKAEIRYQNGEDADLPSQDYERVENLTCGWLDGTSGQDRESYSDTQDRENYAA